MREFKSPNGGRVWIYRPDARPGETLPCILIAPAGSNLLTGKNLSEEDAVEHRPYANAGFVVVAYDVSGAPAPDSPEDEVNVELTEAYYKSNYGTKDALSALEVAKQMVPHIDLRRVYAVGHSSAGSHALMLAAATNQIKGVVAYAPVVNFERSPGTQNIDLIAEEMMLFRTLLQYSPMRQWDLQKAPMFLFHAKDDDVVSIQDIDSYGKLLQKQIPVEQVTVEKGGHYDSMIEQGIPRGLAWLKKLDASLAAKPAPAAKKTGTDINIAFKKEGVQIGDLVYVPEKTTREQVIAALGEPDRETMIHLMMTKAFMNYDELGLTFYYDISGKPGERKKSTVNLLVRLNEKTNSIPIAKKEFPGKIQFGAAEITKASTFGELSTKMQSPLPEKKQSYPLQMFFQYDSYTVSVNSETKETNASTPIGSINFFAKSTGKRK